LPVGTVPPVPVFGPHAAAITRTTPSAITIAMTVFFILLTSNESKRVGFRARKTHECASVPAASKEPQEDTVRPCWNQIRRARLRRYVGPELGGPCKRSMRSNRSDDCGNGCAIAGCEGARAGEGGVTRTILGGEVVPFCAQFNAQHNFASATSGV